MAVTIKSREVGDKIEIVLYRNGKEIRREVKDRVGDQNPAPPIGDAIEDLLASYGITKEWYRSFKKEHGLPPVCDCEARQEWLNKVSAAHPQIASIGVKLLAAFRRK